MCVCVCVCVCVCEVSCVRACMCVDTCAFGCERLRAYAHIRVHAYMRVCLMSYNCEHLYQCRTFSVLSSDTGFFSFKYKSVLLFPSASSYEIRFGGFRGFSDMPYKVVDSDVIQGNLTSPLPAGNTETFVVRARPEHYHSVWWYGVKVIHSGGRISRKSNLVQAPLRYDPVTSTAENTTTTTKTTTAITTPTTTTTTTTTASPATTDRDVQKGASKSNLILYLSIGWNVVLLTILTCIIVRSLYQLRGASTQQDTVVKPDNARLDNVQ